MDNEYQTISVGKELKRIREQRGWTLEAASQVTRIRPDQLDLIEQDRLEEFPSYSYVRGFIRIYSKALGLNPDIVIGYVEKRPEKKIISDDEESFYLDYQPKQSEVQSVSGLDDRAQEWGTKLVTTLVALVIISIIAVVYQSLHNTNGSSAGRISRSAVKDTSLSTEETQLPVVPRERLQAQIRIPGGSEQTLQKDPQKQLSARVNSEPLTAKTETSSNVSSLEPQLTIVRPAKILNIPGTNAQKPANDQILSDNPLSSYTNNNTTEQRTTVPPENLPVKAARLINLASDHNPDSEAQPPQVVIVGPKISQATQQTDTIFQSAEKTTGNQQFNNPNDTFSNSPDHAQNEGLNIFEETSSPEEVTLSDEKFLQMKLFKASVVKPSSASSKPSTNTLQSSTTSHSISLPTTFPRENQIQKLYGYESQDPTDRTFPPKPDNTGEHLRETRLLQASTPGNFNNPANQFTNNFGEMLNQLRLELSREAYVRVFVNDTVGNPALDEILPAGSAASWEGRTFYVTIRPASAATFIYNGKRFDYSHRGDENMTVRFP